MFIYLIIAGFADDLLDAPFLDIKIMIIPRVAMWDVLNGQSIMDVCRIVFEMENNENGRRQSFSQIALDLLLIFAGKGCEWWLF